MKSRKAVRIAVLINVLAHIAFVITLLKWATSLFEEGDISPSLVSSVSSPHTYFIVFALISFFAAREKPANLNLVFKVINGLMALYTLVMALTFV